MKFQKIIQKYHRLDKRIVFFFFTLFMLNSNQVYSIEPDARLFDNSPEVRDSIYLQLSSNLDEKVNYVTNQQELQQLILQRQLLKELREIPESIANPQDDSVLAEIMEQMKIEWPTFKRYLTSWVNVLNEQKLSAKNLETASQQIDVLRSRLLALGKESLEEQTLQLQYACQVRKHEYQSRLDENIRKRLTKIQQEFPLIIDKVILSEEKLGQHLKKKRGAQQKLAGLEEKKQQSAVAVEITMNQQNSLLSSYLGRELSETERKNMYYEQLRLLEMKTEQLYQDSIMYDATIAYLQLAQEALWFQLISNRDNLFTITDASGDIEKTLEGLRKKTAKSQVVKYTLEKELSSMSGGNLTMGPKAQALAENLNTRLSDIFTELSGVYHKAELLEDTAILLGKAVALQQSSLGSVITRTREATDNLFEKGITILKHPFFSYSGMEITLLLVIQVIGVLLSGIVINRLYGHVVVRMGRKRRWTERTIHLIHAVGKYPFIFGVVLIVLSIVGVSTKSFALIAGALSVGVGFGMQTIVNNLVSGIILLFDKSIRPGDFISLGQNSELTEGFRGDVVQMNIRATVLRTNDNINVIIPNADLMASQVVNWTYSDEKIRFRVPFGVAYGSDIDQVKNVIKQAMTELSIVLKKPEPQIWLAEHGESSLAFLAAVWVEGHDARRPAYTKDRVLSAIYKTLLENNIEIPFPQLDLHLRSDHAQMSKKDDTRNRLLRLAEV